MAKRAIKILHSIPKATGNAFALLPIGKYCNQKIQSAEIGSIIEFWQDWKHEKRVLVRKCRVHVKSSVFTFLAQSIYGRVRTTDMLKRWERYSIESGLGKEGFNRDECLLIEVRELTEDEKL